MCKSVPEISRISDFSFQNVIQIYGEQLEKDCKVFVLKTPYFEFENGEYFKQPPLTPPEGAKEYEVDYFTKQVIYVEGRPSIEGGVNIIWVKNSCGFSKPYIANRPQIWNQSLIKVDHGDMFTLYGNNFGDMIDSKHLLLENSATGKKTVINNLVHVGYAYNRENYVVEFEIPKSLPYGEYNAYIHSGSGGAYGWSNPVKLTVEAQKNSAVAFYGNRWNNSVTHSGRLSEDVKTVTLKPNEDLFSDNTADIQAAIDSLKDGGIVHLLPGVYEISKTIELRSGVVLLGSGRELTIFKANTLKGITQDLSTVEYAKRAKNGKGWAVDWQRPYENYNAAALVRLRSDSGVQGIGFELGGGANIGIFIASETQNPVCNAFVNSCKVDAHYLNEFKNERGFGALAVGLLSVSSSNDLSVYDNIFRTCDPLQILPAHNERLKLVNNTLDCSPAQTSESGYICGVYHSVIMGNEFLNGRRILMTQCGFYSNFVYQNRGRGCARSENALEAYMSEYGESLWHGNVKSAGKNYIDISTDIEEYTKPQTVNEYNNEFKLFACVLDGRGFGQYLEVKEYNNGRLYFAEDWTVIPDETTVVTVCKATHHNIWLNNNTDLSNGSSQFIYNAGLENIVCGHETNLAPGMNMYATYNPGTNEGLCCCAYNKIIRCQTKASGDGISIISGTVYMPAKEDFYKRTHGTFGNIIRNNTLDGAPGLMYVKNQSKWIESRGDAALVLNGAYNITEKNRFANYHNAICIINKCEGNYFANNCYYSTLKRFKSDESEIGPDKEPKW